MRVSRSYRAVALTFATTASAQTPPPADGSVVVTMGEGIVKRAPDRAWVTIAAESRAKTPAEVQKLNADAMSAVMQKLKGVGLPAEAIRTAAYELRPEFDYANNRQTLRGYVARNAVEVRVDDLPKLGEVLDVAVGAGATSVSGIRFDLKDRAECRADGTPARSRGREGAGGHCRAGGRDEGGARGADRSAPRRVDAAAAPDDGDACGDGSSAEPPMAPGELEIKATVTIRRRSLVRLALGSGFRL